MFAAILGIAIVAGILSFFTGATFVQCILVLMVLLSFVFPALIPLDLVLIALEIFS